MQTRIRPGQEATLVDIGTNGAFIETCLRLLPGRAIELLFDQGDQPMAVRGRIVRCGVARVQPSRIVYRAAVAFEQPISWLQH